ncbi:MAG: DUF5814 domain-containing protein [Candidatus Asgardarchaeia archaeon]
MFKSIRRSRREKILEFYVFNKGKIYHAKALYKGKMELYDLSDGRIRPFRAWFEQGNQQIYLDPKKINQALKKSEVLLISDDDFPFKSEFMRFLNEFKISYKTVNLCNFCLLREEFTILNRDNSISVYGKLACYDCAATELIHELSSLGIQLTDQFITHLKKLLIIKRDYDAILKMLSGNIDPFKDDSLTRYDIIKPVEFVKKISINTLPIPSTLKEILIKNNITELTNVQALAVDSGLLKGENLLIVSSTTSGKTLIGELAGISRLLSNGRKFVFLVPLVALANQKYEEFKRKYSQLNLKVAIRVGMSRIDVGDEELVVVDSDINNADIIVATYEAFDFILRNRKYTKLRDVGTVVIDEIQMLNDEDRGCELAGVISRLIKVYPKAQYIFLSATVGNPEELANKLNSKLVFYEGRPVPIERHVAFLKNEADKLRLLKKLINAEYAHVSSFGYHGQSIVFTHSRKRASEIASILNSMGVRVAAYHAGLSYTQRRAIELGFAHGVYKAVITTAALGAGVDFPASQVIFYDLAMGSDWLSVAEFNQFLGRAGRLGKHDSGKVWLLIIPGRKLHAGQEHTEDEIAIKLLTGNIESVSVECDFENQAAQVLANIAMHKTMKVNDLKSFPLIDLYLTNDIHSVLSSLTRLNLIKLTNESVSPTELGMAAVLSFFTPRMVNYALTSFEKGVLPIDIAIHLTPLENVYVSSKLHGTLSKIFRTNISTKLFSGHVLDLMNNANRYNKKLPKWVYNTFITWLSEFFNCGCPESPYCDHGKVNVMKKVVMLRKKGLSPSQISNYLLNHYQIHIYPGDIFNWLDSLIHTLEGLMRIATAVRNTKVKDITSVEIKQIERPRR